MAGYQMKITISGSKPPIWRRVLIPDRITFGQLHTIIQETFCWMDYHLHQFEFPSQNLRIVGDIDEEECWRHERVIEENTLIDDFLSEGEKFNYTYDFGDNWEHRILVEKELSDYEYRYPQVVKFKGDVIPEDCGGIWGYYQLLEDLESGISSDPGSETEELEEWACSQGMDEYDMDGVNAVLKGACTFPPSRKKKVREISSKQRDGFNIDLEKAMRDIQKELRRMAKSSDVVGENDFDVYEDSPLETLSQIYRDFDKSDLVELAKENGIKGYSKYNKTQLEKFLNEKMLEPQQMKKAFMKFTDEEIARFERMKQEGTASDEQENAVLMAFAETGYAGMSIYGDIMIPKDVFQAYEKINTEQFRVRRKRISVANRYAEALTELYGVVPGDIYLEVFNKYEENKMLWSEYVSIFKEELGTSAYYKLVDTSLIQASLMEGEEYKQLLKTQEDKPFYIPEKEELTELFETGIISPGMMAGRLYEFLYEKTGADEEATSIICWQIEKKISWGDDMDGLLEIIYEGGVVVQSKKEIKKLVDLLTNLWNNTRMLCNRGFTPVEVNNGYQKSTNNTPDFAKIENSMGKIIPFAREEKKIYPNDPCPCGSGKKYKHCCGKK